NPGGLSSQPNTESPSAPTNPNGSSGFRSSAATARSLWCVSCRPDAHTSAGCVLLWCRYTTPRPSGITCTLLFTPPPPPPPPPPTPAPTTHGGRAKPPNVPSPPLPTAPASALPRP